MEIYYHETCPTSRKLLDSLRKRDIANKVRLIDAKKNSFPIIGRGFVSVPVIRNNIVDYGPVDFEAIEKYIETSEWPTKTFDLEKAIEDITREALDNLFIALSVYLRRSIAILLEYPPLIEKLRLRYQNFDFDKLRSYVTENDTKIFASIEDKLIRYIAFSFIMELKWVYGRKLSIEEFERFYPENVFLHWILARSSVARVGLLEDIASNEELRRRALIIRDIIREKWDKYWDYVLR